MNVTRDVVKDLLTVYSAGEASSDTRALVEEWLRSDPELARQVEQADSVTLPEVPPLPPTVEKQALDRTRRHLRGWFCLVSGVRLHSAVQRHLRQQGLRGPAHRRLARADRRDRDCPRALGDLLEGIPARPCPRWRQAGCVAAGCATPAFMAECATQEDMPCDAVPLPSRSSSVPRSPRSRPPMIRSTAPGG